MLTRRRFVQSTALAGAALIVGFRLLAPLGKSLRHGLRVADVV